ncbi:MAG: glycosyltransferase family 4 protein [Bifidobacterium sp.]|nr:glycosyltransferase family 4 protein [Bifidobacterium sp.]
MSSHVEFSGGSPQRGQRSLRIGIISPYSFETPGGVQNHIRDFAEELISRGHQVSVFAPGRRTKDMPLWVQTNGSSFAIPYNGSWAHLSYFLITGMQTRRWVRQGQFDILHLHEPETPSMSHKPLAMHDAPPMVATFHASIEPYPRALKLFGNYLDRYLSPLREAIYVSPAAGRTADHYLPESVHRQVIPNGIHRAMFADGDVNPDWTGRAGEPTIGFLGRIGEERKGFAVYIRAAERILEQYLHARFLVAGDGEEAGRKTIEETCRDPQSVLGHVEFLGRISDEDKARFYRSLTLYVAPQTGGESFGIVLAEAMAAACPVVASDLPAFVDVTEDGTSARLFANRDASDLADKVLALLDDTGERSRLREEGRRRSRDFDWATVTDQVLGVYRRALS